MFISRAARRAAIVVTGKGRHWMVMGTTWMNLLNRFLNPVWMTGPLLDKELRVSSRRRKNYLLRFAYVAVLTAFVAIIWLAVVETSTSTTFQKSRMALIGKSVISTIITFQFIALQVIAVIMLSTSISDEIHHRTLGLLMTTPISSFQIVMGKLLSKLLQLILLLAISAPLLAILRVFGGVPWDYVLSSLCITLTAVIFAGSLSLLFSVSNSRAHVVIVKTVFVLGTLYTFLPATVAVSPMFLFRGFAGVGSPSLGSSVLLSVFLYVNPFAFMLINTELMISPRAPVVAGFFYWPAHCAIMLCASALLLALCVKTVRRTALRQATGQLELASKRRSRLKRTKSPGQTGPLARPTELVKRLKGSPVLWKELRAPMIQGADNRNSIIGYAITVIALLITYGVCAKQRCLDADFTHVSYALLFVIIGIILNIVFAAGCVTSEKESQAWPILLATSMSDWQILVGKMLAVFRRCLPIWLLLAGHVVLFVLVRYIHPVVMVHLFMVVIWLSVFLTGSAMYFSSRFKRTTSAVVAGFALAFVLWAVVPAILGILSQTTLHSPFFDSYLSANPLVQTTVVVAAAADTYSARAHSSDLVYSWPDVSRHGISRGPATATILLVTALLYVSAGLLFAWRAKCRFRRNVF